MYEEQIAALAKHAQLTNRSFGNEGSITSFVNIYYDDVTVTAPYMIVQQRTLGSTFILNHQIWGKLGASLPAGSQPYLGEWSGSDWEDIRIVSPNNTFIETFDGSRFVE